jgi:hypothetical protein
MEQVMGKKKYYRTKEFIKLQNKWYDKLSKKNFSDLEWLDKKSGSGQSSPFLRDSLSKFKHLEASELTISASYFSDASAFTSLHKFPSKLHKFMWSMFAEGVSYRLMIPQIASRGFKHVPSIFWISIELNKIKRDFWLWQVSQDNLDSPDSPIDIAAFMESNDAINS